MDNVIDFTSIKLKHQYKLFSQYFIKPNSLNYMVNIDKIVEEKRLSIEDHKFFLGFLSFLEKEGIDPVQLLHSLIKYSKYEFELKFRLNWHSVVEFCSIYLAILKKNEPKQYRQFIELQKFD